MSRLQAITAFTILAVCASFAVSAAADVVRFTVPISVDNLQGVNGASPKLRLNCGIASDTPYRLKGSKTQDLPLTNAGYHGTVIVSVEPSDPVVPFAKGDKFICSLDAGMGFANPFRTYLTPENAPAPNQPLTLWSGGDLR